MAIENVRFRVNEGLVVLQVLERKDSGRYGYDREPEWRDAKVEDLLEAAAFVRTDSALRYSTEILRKEIEQVRYEMQQAMRPREE